VKTRIPRPAQPIQRIILVVRCCLVALLAEAGGIRASSPENHWAFQPIQTVKLPKVQAGTRVRNPVDQFIAAGLEARKISPARFATREQLIRRVTFDLIGLPPKPAEINAFLTDRSPDAFGNVIDRLLASPRYGERWARHWLDLARFGESDGFEHDAIRPHAWRFRDYVIRSFNSDKPFDQFVQEQIAGDELWPAKPDALIATAFNLLGPDMVDSADQTQRRLLTVTDMTDTTAFTFLGLTLGCARCHNHKSEPFTQQDYYSLQAFFAPATFERELPVPTSAERDAHELAMERYRAASGPVQQQLDALEQPFRERLYDEKLARLSEDAQLAHRTPKETRTMEQEGTVQETLEMLKIAETELVKAIPAASRARRKALQAELKKVPRPSPLPATMALQNGKAPSPKTFVLARGDYNNPGEEVEPAFPVVLKAGRQKGAFAETIPSETRRRTELARWLSSPKNPLTARVMVNRIWQHHFGRGIVASPSNFGTQGERPTHPELLDWLAGQFIARGWSVKAIHRLILSSATYQQSSEPTQAALVRDPDNRLFSRQTRTRLEGEAIRDSLLAISGRLNLTMGGPSVFPPIPSDITKTSKNWTTSADREEHCRRSIYIFTRRNLRFPFLEVFDAPDSNLSCPERGQSTTAPQSLTLLNSEEVMDAARAMAERLLAEAETDSNRIQRAFRLVLGRRATTNELKMSREFLSASSSGGAKKGWIELCRALFNLNAFVYVD
jgi:hypothetical protein